MGLQILFSQVTLFIRIPLFRHLFRIILNILLSCKIKTMRYFKHIMTSVALICTIKVQSQVITREDSLKAGLVAKNPPTVISGYGQAKVEYDFKNRTGVANLTRNVSFLGHRFSNKISFFSEMEIEDAKIAGGKPSGEISMEQLFVKFNRLLYKLDYYRICFIGTVRHCEERSNLKQSNPFRLLRVENPRNDATYNAFIF
jgi:hypothetical protein